MNRLTFQHAQVQCTIVINENRTLTITGSVIHPAPFARIELMAAAPMDRRTSYSGSGLPFPCSGMALEGTPNYVEVPVTDEGNFSALFQYPNSYLSDDAHTKVPPSVFVVLTPRGAGAGAEGQAQAPPILIRLELPDELPVRTLTDRAERKALGPEFYNAKVEVIGIRGAEATLRALAELKMTRGLA